MRQLPTQKRWKSCSSSFSVGNSGSRNSWRSPPPKAAQTRCNRDSGGHRGGNYRRHGSKDPATRRTGSPHHAHQGHLGNPGQGPADPPAHKLPGIVATHIFERVGHMPHLEIPREVTSSSCRMPGQTEREQPENPLNPGAGRTARGEGRMTSARTIVPSPPRPMRPAADPRARSRRSPGAQACVSAGG